MAIRDIGVLYRRELTCALRERNIVVNSILLPIFLYPLILWLVYTGISFVGGQTQGFRSRILLSNIPVERGAFRQQLEHDDQIELKTSKDARADIRAGQLDALVEFVPQQGAPAEAVRNGRFRIVYDNSKDRSSIARTRMVEKVRRYRDSFLDQEARARGISVAEFQRYGIEEQNVATSRQMGQFLLGLLLPLFLVIMLSVGGMFPAIDSTAGEREKSTWETLMTVATPRAYIVVAKYLYVATMSALAGLLNLAAMLFSMKAVLAPMLGSDVGSFTFTIPARSVPLMVIVTTLLALFIAAVMMILAAFARTFKEGQSMVSPFYVAVFLPAMFLQVPGIEFTLPLALMPVVNVAMVFREAIAGVYHWPQIGLTILVECVCVAGALWLAMTILRYEDFVLGSYGGHFGRFLKERILGRRSAENPR
jgi:sodium transport system permease protein